MNYSEEELIKIVGNIVNGFNEHILSIVFVRRSGSIRFLMYDLDASSKLYHSLIPFVLVSKSRSLNYVIMDVSFPPSPTLLECYLSLVKRLKDFIL